MTTTEKPESTTVLPTATGCQLLELLILPNDQKKHWTDAPMGAEVFTPSMQATYRDFLTQARMEKDSEPVLVQDALAELMTLVLHHRISEIHHQELQKLLGDEESESWSLFMEHLQDQANTTARFMFDAADDLLAEFVALTSIRLKQLQTEATSATSQGDAHHG